MRTSRAALAVDSDEITMRAGSEPSEQHRRDKSMTQPHGSEEAKVAGAARTVPQPPLSSSTTGKVDETLAGDPGMITGPVQASPSVTAAHVAATGGPPSADVTLMPSGQTTQAATDEPVRVAGYKILGELGR